MILKRLVRWKNQAVLRAYEIDRYGNISCTIGDLEVLYKRKLSPGKKKKYYWHALLRIFNRDRWVAIHRIMCYTWLGAFPHPLRRICDHIDSDSENNKFWNLRYLTIRGNNLNRAGVKGVVERDGKWYPRIAGFVHEKYGHDCIEFAQKLRYTLLQSYIRYTMRFPENDHYPHRKIYEF